MRRPSLGEANLGAVAGAVVGGIGGIFAIGIARAVIEGKLFLLFGTPVLGLLCLILSLPVGWLIGGQVGPRIGFLFRSERAEIAGGMLGGMVPVTLIALLGWYLVTPH